MDELGKRGLNKKGWKPELVQCMKEAMSNRLPIMSVSAQAEAAKDDVDGFPPTARKRTLGPQMEVVPEPRNRSAGASAPTVPEEDATFIQSNTISRRLLIVISSRDQNVNLFDHGMGGTRKKAMEELQQRHRLEKRNTKSCFSEDTRTYDQQFSS
jgi:hypothetical protein